MDLSTEEAKRAAALWRFGCAQYMEGDSSKQENGGMALKRRRAEPDITGRRWGMLTAVRQIGYATAQATGKRQALWLWRCDCGNEKAIPATQVKHAGTRSCGCMRKAHIAGVRQEDIAGRRFGRLTAAAPTAQRDAHGNIIWALDCQCGGKAYKTVNELKTGRVLSCGCYYRQTRTALAQYRRDFVDHTSLSAIVLAKKPQANNSSGQTGVYLNKRSGRWEAYISYQKTRIRLGTYRQKSDAIDARREAERRIHDPVVMAHWDCLTEERKREFAQYLRQSGAKRAQT